ncbi:hypothetical protein DERP_011523 [Dermatophagoides pteronyssinus]|uniref:27 kDa hemolymph protein-like n=1 Tax=Dermatophagoides pteronyssinus TaxID=6956 RepID=A0ABQ8JC40_DERPT|nr:hypothetical protein DERP_011523 [Dermatophagoides pteronyssinus]
MFIRNIVLIVVVAIIGPTWTLRTSSECDIKKPVQECLHLGFLLESDSKKFRGFPTTMSALNDKCNELKRSEECATNFINRCSDNSFEERILNHLLEGSNRVMKRLCRTNARKKELLGHVSCANSVVDDTYRCVGDYKKLVFAANKLQDKHKILRILCCKIRQTIPCVGKAMRAKGPSVCSKDDIDYMREMQQKVRLEMTSIVCADYDRDKCENVEIPPITEAEYKGKSLYEPLRVLYRKVVRE